MTGKDTAEAAVGALGQAFFTIGQHALPLLFPAGAVISAVQQHRRKGLLDTAAQRDAGANIRGLSWRATRVGVSVVRELYGVMAAQGAAEGVVVTSGGFTPDAVEFAAGRNLRQIAGPELEEMIRAAGTGAFPHETSATDGQPLKVAGDPACPRCGSAMVRRTAKRGPSIFLLIGLLGLSAQAASTEQGQVRPSGNGGIRFRRSAGW